MKGNLKRPDFRELMNPLLRTTAGILFFSWFFYRSVFAVILFIFPGILYFRKCVREQREKKTPWNGFCRHCLSEKGGCKRRNT